MNAKKYFYFCSNQVLKSSLKVIIFVYYKMSENSIYGTDYIILYALCIMKLMISNILNQLFLKLKLYIRFFRAGKRLFHNLTTEN